MSTTSSIMPSSFDFAPQSQSRVPRNPVDNKVQPRITRQESAFESDAATGSSASARQPRSVDAGRSRDAPGSAAAPGAPGPGTGGQLWNPHVDPLFRNDTIEPPPVPHRAAQQFAADYLRTQGIAGDPDQIFFTKWVRGDPSVRPVRVMSLTDMVLQNRQHELNDDAPALRIGFTDANGKEITKLDVRDFQNHIWHDNFAAIYDNQVNAYFDRHGGKLASYLQAGMAKTLTSQVRDGSLSKEGAGIVSRGLGVGPYTDWNKLSPDQLRNLHPDPDVAVQPLKINDAVSTQAFLFTDRKTQETTLYLPGNSRPFHPFRSQNEIPEWLLDNVIKGGKEAQDQFTAYFPQDKENGLRQLYANLAAEPKHLRETDYFDVTHLTGEPLAPDNPAKGMIESLRQQQLTAGKEEIVSDEQWGRQTALKYISTAGSLLLPVSLIAPEAGAILGAGLGAAQASLGIYQHDQGRSSQERKGGLDNVAQGFLNAATSLFGAEIGVSAKGAPHPGDNPAPTVAPPVPPPESPSLPTPQESIGGYATPITPSELAAQSKPDGRGVHHIGDKQYITYGGKAYQVRASSADPQRAALIDPATQEETGQHFKRDVNNQWKPDDTPKLRGGGKLGQVFSSKYRQARTALDDLIKGPKSADEMSAPEREAFGTNLQQLIETSNAEVFPNVQKYIHADTHFVNAPLREGRNTQALDAFLDEFKLLNSYDGRAYRSAYVTPEGRAALKNGVGKTFRDLGVQSASTQPVNVYGWEESWSANAAPREATQKVIYLFDENVPKKNLSTAFLSDHVAISPGTPTKVLAVKESNGTLYVYLAAPTKMPEHVYNPYNGRQEL